MSRAIVNTASLPAAPGWPCRAKPGKPFLRFSFPTRFRRVRLLFALLAVLLPLVSQAAWERTGATPSGAVYRLAVPEGWRAGDGLVVYQHELAYEAVQPPDLGPLLDHQLAQGYAVAASAYRQTGWALFAAGQDNRELVERFRVEFGDPGRVLTYGRAMGGQIALQMAQHPANTVDGVLALCPSVAGHLDWEAALDLRVVYDAVCADVDGGQLPSAVDRPWLVPAGEVSPHGLARTVLAVNQCLGLDQPSWLRSDPQQQRLAQLKQAAGLADDHAVLPQLAYATLGLTDLMRDPGKLAGGLAIGNQGVDYGDAVLNDQVARIDRDPFAALALRRLANVADGVQGKVLSLHPGNDPLIRSGHQHELRRQLPESRLSSVLVHDESGAQCHFSNAELVTAWDALDAWTQGQHARPDAVELQAHCLATEDAGIAAGPCRIDPDLQPLALADTHRHRPLPVEAVDTRFSGSWYDPTRNGEGWLIEVLDDRNAQIYGFTFPTSTDTGEQLWLTGTGRIDGDGIVVDRLERLDSGRFADGKGQPPNTRDWGSARFVFPACGQARLRVQGPEGYGYHERDLVQLTALAGQSCDRAASAESAGLGAFSGSFYDPATPGQGLVIGVDDQGAVTGMVFSYDLDGGPLWLFARGALDLRGRLLLGPALQPVGTRYDRFEPGDIEHRTWGAVLVEFNGCDQATLHFVSDTPGYGDGRLPLRRLTRPAGIGTCAMPRTGER